MSAQLNQSYETLPKPDDDIIAEPVPTELDPDIAAPLVDIDKQKSKPSLWESIAWGILCCSSIILLFNVRELALESRTGRSIELYSEGRALSGVLQFEFFTIALLVGRLDSKESILPAVVGFHFLLALAVYVIYP